MSIVLNLKRLLQNHRNHWFVELATVLLDFSVFLITNQKYVWGGVRGGEATWAISLPLPCYPYWLFKQKGRQPSINPINKAVIICFINFFLSPSLLSFPLPPHFILILRLLYNGKVWKYFSQSRKISIDPICKWYRCDIDQNCSFLNTGREEARKRNYAYFWLVTS